MKGALTLLGWWLLGLLACADQPEEDPGRAPIGSLQTILIYATDDDPSSAGAAAKELDAGTVSELKKTPKLGFDHYRMVGSDTQDILRGYENWATPIRPAKDILVRFEPRQRPAADKIQLDLEYWQGRRKIMATDPTLTVKKPLYISGPKWRKGRLILQVTVLELR